MNIVSILQMSKQSPKDGSVLLMFPQSASDQAGFDLRPTPPPLPNPVSQISHFPGEELGLGGQGNSPGYPKWAKNPPFWPRPSALRLTPRRVWEGPDVRLWPSTQETENTGCFGGRQEGLWSSPAWGIGRIGHSLSLWGHWQRMWSVARKGPPPS